jgi:hypothetical protein
VGSKDVGGSSIACSVGACSSAGSASSGDFSAVGGSSSKSSRSKMKNENHPGEKRCQSLRTFIRQQQLVFVERAVSVFTVADFKVQEIIVVTRRNKTFSKQISASFLLRSRDGGNFSGETEKSWRDWSQLVGLTQP